LIRADDSLSLAEARYIALVAQRLEPGVRRGDGQPTKAELLATIDQIGCVQLDSISVVSRAHETSIWSRLGSFDTAALAELHFPDAALIEYWAHAASLMPVAAFPFLRRNMEAVADPGRTRWGRWAAENRALIDSVLATIDRDGPVSTRAFERPAGVERTPWAWYGGKPAKQALDYLWIAGELVVLRRAGFERIYDLTDRALPFARAGALPSTEEQDHYFTSCSLRALGVATAPWVADYFHGMFGRYVALPETTVHLDNLVAAGAAVRVSIAGQSGAAWLDARHIPALEAMRAGTARPTNVTLLSPFDNLMWRRVRALALFGMDYRLESYTPEAKRQFGYYSLPILMRGELVGRLDARYRRKERLLAVQSIHLEPGVRFSEDRARRLARALKDFAGFLGGEDISIAMTDPARLGPALLKHLA
jgi:uncharacterized protein